MRSLRFFSGPMYIDDYIYIDKYKARMLKIGRQLYYVLCFYLAVMHSSIESRYRYLYPCSILKEKQV